MKSIRLFNILMLLIERRKVTSTELSQILEVSVRTIYRDINILAQAGIPLYTTTGKYGGVHLMDGFIVDKAMFSEREKEEILVSLQSVKGLPGLDIEQVRNKISAIFNQPATNNEWLEIDFSSTTPDGENLFSAIKIAIQNKQALRITYMNANGLDSERFIEPIKLVCKYMSWYLFAFCKMRKEYRWFRITRIIDFELSRRSFTQNHDQIKAPEILTTIGGYGELIHVELVFSRDVAHFVYDAFDKKDIQLGKDDVYVSMDRELNEWFIITLSSFGPNVTILEPPALKDIIFERHRQALEHYSNGI